MSFASRGSVRKGWQRSGRTRIGTTLPMVYLSLVCHCPVVTKRYITFGDNGRGRVLSEGEIKVSDKITLRCVALVQSLEYNFLSVSQPLDEGFEVLFQPGGSRILDSRGDLVCMVVPKVRCFELIFLSLLVLSVVSWLVLRVSCVCGIGSWVT
jgi:hypothetical protein